ncbi:hypothetical protein SAMN06264364_11483 [Quadrisphaera granulorum]|uniref:Uncharacterized protein n=1 Tax=Quadrisphaera granulorum TaxID=317664 RepID=A0A316A7K4_9ACTN|nr:hypothetical protein [Quadrisphaera granulorum]PWJ53188.1 hypothetical protein BXY45_11483 [Quadrisphaera granulorum]SZE97120.1 hypothetical protein SAMN06264364_11483 [Quadrisphaera granulorum]
MGWWWVAVYLGLGLVGVVVLGILAWGVVKKGFAVFAALGEASARAGELMAQVEHLPAQKPAHSVMDDPYVLQAQRRRDQAKRRRLRAKRVAAQREARREQLRLRRAAS